MRIQTFMAGLVLSLSLGAVHAAPQISVPFQPSGPTLAMVDSAGIWAEVYPATSKEVPVALERGLRGEPPVDKVAAIVVQSTLHFTWGKTKLQLLETSASTTRNGQLVDYDEQCTVYPKNGDGFTATYAKDGSKVTAELDVKVVKYLPFSEESDEPLDLSKPENCQRETHSRMFFSGELRVKQDGKVQQVLPVLMQSIVEPHFN